MSLKGYGEDRLVAELTKGLEDIGDDCAALPGDRPGELTLLKTDAVIEDIHFLATAPPKQIGWKALCRALSDIGAMGGKPVHALVTIAMPDSTELLFIKRIYAGIRAAADQFGVRIVGGETCRSPGPIFISIALTGTVAADRCIRRSGARPGDFIYVTGNLGGSFRGKHLKFTPRVAEGQWLAATGAVTAMMDLSDGLGSDLPRMTRASHCNAEVHPNAVPRNSWCRIEGAFTDGEDYELLLAVRADGAAKLEKDWALQFPKLPLTQIGVFTPPKKLRRKSYHGYDHFA